MVALTLATAATLGLYTFAAAGPQYGNPPVTTASAGYGEAPTHGGKPSRTTFLEPTATDANPTATGLTVDDGKAYIQYSVVPGIFQQDSNATNATTFDYTSTNFGLLNRTYPGDSRRGPNITQWQRFDRYLSRLNEQSSRDTDYKLVFLGRHGEGFHNAAQTFYGTPAWNCYWAEANGNSTANWADARLTQNGINQAQTANDYWRRLLSEQKITPPESFYTSPLTRCLQTSQITFANLTLPKRYPFKPTIKELLREGISIHTCDHRSNKTDIAARYPSYTFESTFTEQDELWSGIVAESASAQDYRSKVLLDSIFSTDDRQILSFTSHSGEGASILRTVGHIPFSLSTGAVIPFLVKAETTRKKAPSVTTTPWATNAWCTNAPPITSVATGCVCQDGVQPTAVSPGSVFTTNPARL